MREYRYIVVVFAALSVLGCNLFSVLESPSGDKQILSKARACLDNADYTCAREYYAKLSGSYSDVALSELAFTALDQLGAGMGTFTAAFGTGGVTAGKGLTRFAARMQPRSSLTTRLSIYNDVLQRANQISSSSPELKHIVRLVGGVAMAAEILAEAALSAGTFQRSDLATTPDSCSAVTCGGAGACSKPAASSLVQGTAVAGTGGYIENATTSEISVTSPSLELVHASILTVNNAIQNLGSTSGVGSTLSGLLTALGGVTPAATADARCYRAALLSADVGRTQ